MFQMFEEKKEVFGVFFYYLFISPRYIIYILHILRYNNKGGHGDN